MPDDHPPQSETLAWTIGVWAAALLAAIIIGAIFGEIFDAAWFGWIVGIIVFFAGGWYASRFLFGPVYSPTKPLRKPTGGWLESEAGVRSRARMTAGAQQLGTSADQVMRGARARMTRKADDETQPTAAVRPAAAPPGAAPEPVPSAALAPEPVAEPRPEPAPAPAEAPQPSGRGAEETVAVGDSLAPGPGPDAAPDAGERPPRLEGPHGEGADELKRIKGIGPKLEKQLNELGYYHYAQLAAWTPAQVEWIDAQAGTLSGRASRDGWVEQARALAAEPSPETTQGGGA